MTETTRKGWVMVDRNDGWIFEWTFSYRRKDAVREACLLWSGLTRRQVLRRYKPVKATMTLTLEDE